MGTIVNAEADSTSVELLGRYKLATTDSMLKYSRLLLEKEMYHSKIYKRTTRRNNYAIAYETTGARNYGLISFFCVITPANGESSAKEVVAVIEELIPHPTMKLSHDSITHLSISHIVPCINSSKLLIISVTSIKHKVVYYEFQ